MYAYCVEGKFKFNILDFNKIEIQQSIEPIFKNFTGVYPNTKLSRIGEFKVQSSDETFKAFLAFSARFDKLFVCPLNEIYSNIR